MCVVFLFDSNIFEELFIGVVVCDLCCVFIYFDYWYLFVWLCEFKCGKMFGVCFVGDLIVFVCIELGVVYVFEDSCVYC